MIEQITTSDASKSGVFRYTGRCEFYDSLNRFCSVGQGQCVHEGLKDDCKVVQYYQESLDRKSRIGRRKTFIERYGEDWRQQCRT